MGTFVIFDLYWDTVAAFDDETDAQSYVASHESTHYHWVGDATIAEFRFLDGLPKPWEDDWLLTPQRRQASGRDDPRRG